jgi:hypothetical protein
VRRQFTRPFTVFAFERLRQLGVLVRLPARQVTVADAELDIRQVGPQPSDDRLVAADEMAGQQQVAHDQLALPRDRGEVSGHDPEIILDARDPPGTAVVAELEVGEIDLDRPFEQRKRFGSPVEIRLPDDGRQVGTPGHHLKDRGDVHCGFAADPLERPRPLTAALGDGLVKE